MVGLLPEKLIDLAASAKNADTLYAATEGGLLVSKDGGRSWETVVDSAPVSLVEVTAVGSLYAFVLGLERAEEADMVFKTTSASWGDQILLHIAVDPTDSNRMFVASHQGDIFASTDGGANWVAFGP